MAIIYGTSGAYNELLSKINEPSIQSLKDINDFKRDFTERKEEISQNNRSELEKEIVDKRRKVESLFASLEDGEAEKRGSLGLFLIRMHIKFLLWRVKGMERNFDVNLETKNRIDTNSLEVTYNAIKENNNILLGTVAELKVIEELCKLPDSYFVINDLRMSFCPPIHNRVEDDRICSVQIDHIVIGPSGVFIIETKNWSKKNNKNPHFFSPVKQVKRAGFALFVYLNSETKNIWGHLKSFRKEWGVRKISLRQIVVTMNNVSFENSQYVKVLGLDELNRYIIECEVQYSEEEINDLVSFLKQFQWEERGNRFFNSK